MIKSDTKRLVYKLSALGLLIACLIVAVPKNADGNSSPKRLECNCITISGEEGVFEGGFCVEVFCSG